VDSIFDLTELSEEDRNSMLQLNPAQMSDVAIFCNQYPSIDVNVELEDKVWVFYHVKSHL
jgi:pre-mRNA-splicing helicase BRR2